MGTKQQQVRHAVVCCPGCATISTACKWQLLTLGQADERRCGDGGGLGLAARSVSLLQKYARTLVVLFCTCTMHLLDPVYCCTVLLLVLLQM